VLFGGSADDSGEDIALDPFGRVFVIGFTFSTNFPVASPFGLFRSYNSGNRDAFVTAFNTNGTSVRYSAYLGGSGNDYGYGIAVDSESSAYITGLSYSTNFPVGATPFQSAARGPSSAFLAKARLSDPPISVSVSAGNAQVRWPATAPDYSLQASAGLNPPQPWSAVTQTPVLSNGFYNVVMGPTNGQTFFRLHR
jgi:hypothetical protein